MLRRIVCAVVVTVALALPANAVFAQDGDPAAEPAEDPKAQAQVHWEAGLRAYNVGDFGQAITEWKAGYRLHGSPVFLLNIAQAYRGSRDYKNAIFFFNTYLRESPDAANREEVIGLRDELQKLLTDETSTKNVKPKEPIPPDGDTNGGTETGGTDGTGGGADLGPSGPADLPSSDGRTLKLTGMIAAGAGIALVGTGVVFAFAASSAESDLEKAAADGEPWSQALQDKEDSGERNAMLGKVFVITGVAAMVGGGVAYVMGYSKAKKYESARASRLDVQPMVGRVNGVQVRIDF
jgi:ABC-type cobalt transport system substrate-binding protein